jgi:hypothetical protein
LKLKFRIKHLESAVTYSKYPEVPEKDYARDIHQGFWFAYDKKNIRSFPS